MIALVVSAGGTLMLDLCTKRAVRILAPGREISWGHLVRVCRVTNINRIYGNNPARILMTIAWLWALASAIVLHYTGLWFHGQLSLIGIGLALGGAAGNLLDIWRHRGVVDFIDLGWWPVFNFADVGIVGGLLLSLFN